MRSFASMHPLVLFLYYVFVMTLTMFLMHPVILILSLIGSLIFFSLLVPNKEFLRDFGFYILVFFLIAVTNPLFVHKGETILFFLNDNPVTKEAFMYGFFIALMLVAVIYWSKSYSYLMTSDKFIYLFGKAIPKLSLIISMALRFIPQFKLQIKRVNQAQKTLGFYTSDSLFDRVMSGVRTFNSLLTWSLENSIIQADSMKARGYGLKGRTNFALFRFTNRDFGLLIVMSLLFIYILFLNVQGEFTFTFYPLISQLEFSFKTVINYLFIFLLIILPSLIEVKENLQWRYFVSKI